MISFIIIGLNEGWRLTKCLQSVYNTIEYNKLKSFEIIYIDSGSEDDSIERAKQFKDIKIFLISGKRNAAVARNIGAKEAKGDILFFIDGDMEIERNFLSYAIINNQLKYDCITGHIDDLLYDMNDNFLGLKKRTYKNKIPNQEQILKTNGGIFLIKKKVWDFVGGMRTKYKQNEDIDLSLRLFKKGYKIIRLPVLISKHHTIEYSNENRMWQSLKNCYVIYPAIILRDFITTPYVLKYILRSNYTEITLLLTILSAFFFNTVVSQITILYLFLLLSRVSKHTISSILISKSKIRYFLERFIYQLLKDFLFWFTFFFIYPSDYQLIDYHQIK